LLFALNPGPSRSNKFETNTMFLSLKFRLFPSAKITAWPFGTGPFAASQTRTCFALNLLFRQGHTSPSKPLFPYAGHGSPFAPALWRIRAKTGFSILVWINSATSSNILSVLSVPSFSAFVSVARARTPPKPELPILTASFIWYWQQ
jgi:hypothetical protein